MPQIFISTDMRQQLIFILLLIALFTFVKQAEAQNLQRMSIEREEAGTGIPVFTQHPDKAGIVIESSVPNLRFSSNMQGIIEVREPAAGRYVLIVEPFTQIIRVDAENFVQERFRVGNPRARDVLYFSVSPQQEHSDVISVIFNVQPEDALLFLDGREVETNTTVQLPARGYELRLERDGYRSINKIVNVSPDNILFNYNMEEIDILPVRILSNVEGARVFVDGTERGQIDRSGTYGIFLFPGKYNIALQAPGFISANEVLEVSETSENEFEIKLTENVGYIDADVEPSDANVRVDGELQFPEEGGKIKLRPDSYLLEISASGYLSYSENINISLGDTLQRNITLEQNAGILQLDVTPANATLEINRRPYNAEQQIELTPGRYRIEISKEGYESYSENIDIERGELVSRRVMLEMQTGAMQFSVVPGDANVILMDTSGVEIERWEGINVLQNLQALTYILNITAEGHIDESRQITITEDEMLELSIELEEAEDWEEVTNPVTGRTWMDRNLGASRVATSPDDAKAFGDLYQWGRAGDGHEKRRSETITNLNNKEKPEHSFFILTSKEPYDWLYQQNNNMWQGIDGLNNPCPDGFRLPTEEEWDNERLSWESYNAEGAFKSPLKLPLAGSRSSIDGSLLSPGFNGIYWSSSIIGDAAYRLFFNEYGVNLGGTRRAVGRSVRCIEE
jgi:uncharacterized protein (TIGR02145 family)